MQDPSIPIVVLAGSDRRASAMPPGTEDLHQLTGYKGMDIRLGGRPLIEVVVERLERSGCFAAIYVAGPARVYRSARRSARLIDTDGGFGDNIRAAIEAVRHRHPGSPIAFITCDVILDPAELRKLWSIYLGDAPCNLWFPMVHIEREQLGASAWKPTYRMKSDESSEARDTLGGHLLVADPAALRLDLLYRVFGLAYSTRNRSLDRRRSVIVRTVLGELLREDLRRLLALRWPGMTWTTLRAGVTGVRRLRNGTLSVQRLAGLLADIFVRGELRHASPNGGVVTRIVDDLALALDIDTEEEARAHGGDVAGAQGPS